MNGGGFEIERKFLIGYPTAQVLSQCRISHIVQTYLVPDSEGWTERVRARTSDGGCVYTHTRKLHISSVRRVEDEHEVSREEYEKLLTRADPRKKPIEKRRGCYLYRDQLFEIDLYPFWQDRAIMELELTGEEQEIFLPPEIHIIKEVTDDKRYTNSSLARTVPMDEIGKETL